MEANLKGKCWSSHFIQSILQLTKHKKCHIYFTGCWLWYASKLLPKSWPRKQSKILLCSQMLLMLWLLIFHHAVTWYIGCVQDRSKMLLKGPKVSISRPDQEHLNINLTWCYQVISLMKVVKNVDTITGYPQSLFKHIIW